MKKYLLGLPASIFLLFLVALSIGAQEHSQPTPFGFKMGMTKAQIINILGEKAIKEAKEDSLVLSSAPAPHPDFDTYVVVISPDKGLLKVGAIGKPISVNDEGNELKEQFEDVYTSLAAKYGNGEKLDFVQGGEANKEPQYWMMTLLDHERTLLVCWNYEEGNSGTGQTKTGVLLEAHALSINVGNLTLEYEFPGWSNYLASKEARQNSVF